jgi:hypothetical protein
MSVLLKWQNEKDLSDSEMESDLKEDIVFGKLFDFSRDCWQVWCLDLILCFGTF